MWSALTINDDEGHKTQLLKVMDILIAQIVVMVTQVYTYVQTHQIMYINCVHFVYLCYLSKAIKSALSKNKKYIYFKYTE